MWIIWNICFNTFFKLKLEGGFQFLEQMMEHICPSGLEEQAFPGQQRAATPILQGGSALLYKEEFGMWRQGYKRGLKSWLNAKLALWPWANFS